MSVKLIGLFWYKLGCYTFLMFSPREQISGSLDRGAWPWWRRARGIASHG